MRWEGDRLTPSVIGSRPSSIKCFEKIVINSVLRRCRYDETDDSVIPLLNSYSISCAWSGHSCFCNRGSGQAWHRKCSPIITGTKGPHESWLVLDRIFVDLCRCIFCGCCKRDRLWWRHKSCSSDRSYRCRHWRGAIRYRRRQASDSPRSNIRPVEIYCPQEFRFLTSTILSSQLIFFSVVRQKPIKDGWHEEHE